MAMAMSEPMSSIVLNAPVVRGGIAAVQMEREVQQMPQVSTIQYKHHIEEHIKEVEVPQVDVHHYEEDHVQRYVHEEMHVVERAQFHELIREELAAETVEKVKEVTKQSYHQREVVAEVPHIVNHEIVQEVPQTRFVDLVREVPREVRQTTSKQVHKPVNQFREVMVEVPHTTTTERLQEVPIVERAEILKQVPGQLIVEEVVKEVKKHEVELATQHEDCVHIEYEERIIEVPQVEVREVVKQVPKIVVEYIEKRVEKKNIEYVEKIVEVPHIIYEERIVEVPELEVREVIRQVPKAVTQFVDKPITKRENRYLEKIVEVPHTLEQERAIEVPQVVTVETQTQVLKPEWDHREKAVQKVVIEPREVQIETCVVSKHEQAREYDDRQIVDTVREIHKHVTEVVEKQVPHITTEVVEEEQLVHTNLKHEKAHFVPQIQEVDLLIEKPQPVVREIEKEIPKWRMEYKEIEKKVHPKFVVPDPEEEMMEKQGLVSRDIDLFGEPLERQYEGFSIGGEAISDFVVEKKHRKPQLRSLAAPQQVGARSIVMQSMSGVQTQSVMVGQTTVSASRDITINETIPVATPTTKEETGFFASIKHALGMDGKPASHQGSQSVPPAMVAQSAVRTMPAMSTQGLRPVNASFGSAYPTYGQPTMGSIAMAQPVMTTGSIAMAQPVYRR